MPHLRTAVGPGFPARAIFLRGGVETRAQAQPERQEKRASNFRASLVTLVAAMTRKALIFLLALFVVQAAHADSLKDALNHKYKHHILALRSPFTGSDQKFDSAGRSLDGALNSAWLFYGGVYVEKLNLSSNTVLIQGPLAAFAGEKKDDGPVLVRFSKSQRIEIHLDRPLNSFEDVQAVLGRVFFLGTDAAGHAKPELRRADDTTPDDQIYDYHLGGVTAPKSIFTPTPEFSEEARREKFQGELTLAIVVDKMGNVARIRMKKVLGHRLDENALEAVKAWRFTPGNRNGEPVAVAMDVEVSFNRY